jgi:hypothetical protein
MRELYYWQSWDSIYKIIFWTLLAVFFVLVVAVIVLQAMGTDSLIDWHVLTRESSYTIDYYTFTKGPFSFSIPADKTILIDLFSGGMMPSTTLASKFLIAIITTCLLLYLAITTMFTRTWYLISMGGLLAFLVMLHVETVQIFGWSDTKVLILMFILLLTPSYYLHAFSNGSIIKRLWIIAGALAVLTGIIILFAAGKHPFISLLNYGILAPYIIILLFVISVAHEIIAFFISTITATEGIGNKAKLRHFLIISAIYITNILMSFLYTAHYIDWQLFYINPFFLLIVSAILGIWGSRLRASLYGGAANQEVLWPLLYVIIAIVSFATLAFFMFALNDPFLKVVGDLIIYAHLAIGIAFTIYILYNFIPLIEKGFKIQNILYNPVNLPYFTYRILGIMIVVALFAIRGFDYPVWYSMGGYNNAKADMVLADGYLDVAEAHFINADAFAYHNHKANYSLGMMLAGTEPLRAIDYFGKAMDQQPSGQTIVNRANLQNTQQDYYSALFTLQEGKNLVKDDYHVYNNLALQFEKVKVLDSAIYYFQLGGTEQQTVNSNRIAYSAKYGLSLGKDSVSIYSKLNRAGKVNAMALGIYDKQPDLVSANHMYDMALLNNWLLTDAPGVTDSSLFRAKTVIDSTSDDEYRNSLLFSWSLAAFKAGNITRAIEGLSNLSYNSTELADQAKLALGKIYLDLGAYNMALDFFHETSNGQMSLAMAIASLEDGNYEESLPYWQFIAQGEDKFLSSLAKDIILSVYEDRGNLDSDRKKYLFARYKRYYIDESEENNLLNEIQDISLRADLALDLAAFYHKFDNPKGAELMLKNIETLDLTSEQFRRFIIWQALINHDSENVQKRLIKFESRYSFNDNEYLLENTLNHLAGVTLDSLSYLQMAQDDPFFPEAIIIGSRHFDNDKDPFRSYTFLANAVQANPSSPILLRAYILKALDVGLNQFAENAMYEYSQRFSGQSYMVMQNEYLKKIEELNKLLESEPID